MGRNVVVVIGVGGMGEAIARRQGPGNRLLLADFDEATLAAVAERLRGQGHEVVTQAVDVSSASSVTALAETAAGLGPVTQVVHTAGLSPVQASPAAVLRVDLLGTALVVEEFGHVVAPVGAGVVIASMAGHMLRTPLTAEQESALAHTPAGELLRLPFADPEALGQGAYGLAKYGNRLRVQAASAAWGARGARINSVSPGVIATPMGQQEPDHARHGRRLGHRPAGHARGHRGGRRLPARPRRVLHHRERPAGRRRRRGGPALRAPDSGRRLSHPPSPAGA